MDIITIIVSVISAGGFLGIFEFIKWLYNRKDEKKSVVLDNTAKQQEIEEKKSLSTLEEWERLSAQHERDLEYYRTSLQERDATIREKEERIDTKDQQISDLKEEQDRLRSLLVKVKCTRCDVIGCPDRKPPLGYVDVPLEDMYKDL